MADLIAQGRDSQNRWRRPIPAGESLVLGRGAGDWGIRWDDQISRKHAEIRWREGKLEVRRLDTALNPVFLRGRETPAFTIRPGEHFVIGETTFILKDDLSEVTYEARTPLQERSFSAQELKDVQFRDADRRLDVLGRLPEVISKAADDPELFARLVELLLAGIPKADAVALVAANSAGEESESVRVLHWDDRMATGGRFQPSARLILESMRRDQSVLHVWAEDDNRTARESPVSEQFDWEFCTPVRGESSEGWGISVAGRLARSESPLAPPTDPVDLRDAVKFTELAAAILAALRHARRLQRRAAILSQFFSPVVLRTLADRDAEAILAPKKKDVTVLFCDLRGFSRKVEQAGDDLIGLLGCVGRALQVMTERILDLGGVVGDFQGDAAMGFWGWPLEHPDAVRRACLAALGICSRFEAAARRDDDCLGGFLVGIGIATGPAVVGKIGTMEQAKVGVLGPTVNLAARLEGLSKIVLAPIVMDEATARFARAQLDPTLARVRNLAVVRPFGMDRALAVSELLPPLADYPLMEDAHIAHYEQALEAFTAGKWSEAHDLLHQVTPVDRTKDFLTRYILLHNRVAPPGWDGVITLDSKA